MNDIGEKLIALAVVFAIVAVVFGAIAADGYYRYKWAQVLAWTAFATAIGLVIPGILLL